MHFGKRNPKHSYSLGETELGVIESQRDLGVHIMSSLKSEKQVTESVKRANRQLGMIKRTLTCRNSAIMLPLYKTLVRPHLEYCVQAWAPHYNKDINNIENVQKPLIKMISGLNSFSYEDKLKEKKYLR